MPVDGTGVMYDGTKLNGPVALRNAILSHSEAYLSNFAENMLAYGVGRVLDYKDMPAVRVIEHSAAANNNRFSAFIMGVVKSPQFQMRRAEEPVSATSAANNQ